MADIYTLAKEVLVWLGPEADNSTSALETLRNMGNLVEIDFATNTLSPSSNARYRDEIDLSNPCRFIFYSEDHGSNGFGFSKRLD